MENEDDETDQSKPYSIYYDSSTVHHKLNPDCPVCLKPVFWSRHILSLDRVWHLQCYICSYCFKPLKPGEQSFYGGKLFCTEPCFNELFLGHCTENPVVNANAENATNADPTKERPVHSACLHCTNCERLIVDHHHHRLTSNYPHCKFPGYKENVETYQKNEKKLTGIAAVPNQAAANLNRSIQASVHRCVRCLKTVYAAEQYQGINFAWHLNCLRCSICDRKLQPAAHAVHDGLPICNLCYKRIYLFGGYRKGWQECKP